jgi:hypothetical protein
VNTTQSSRWGPFDHESSRRLQYSEDEMDAQHEAHPCPRCCYSLDRLASRACSSFRSSSSSSCSLLRPLPGLQCTHSQQSHNGHKTRNHLPGFTVAVGGVVHCVVRSGVGVEASSGGPQANGWVGHEEHALPVCKQVRVNSMIITSLSSRLPPPHRHYHHCRHHRRHNARASSPCNVFIPSTSTSLSYFCNKISRDRLLRAVVAPR